MDMWITKIKEKRRILVLCMSNIQSQVKTNINLYLIRHIRMVFIMSIRIRNNVINSN
jgi:hypothetical protein